MVTEGAHARFADPGRYINLDGSCWYLSKQLNERCPDKGAAADASNAKEIRECLNGSLLWALWCWIAGGLDALPTVR
jgi:hypothetical protein